MCKFILQPVCALQLSKAAAHVSSSINSRRTARGLQPRAVRACVIGFPNVGKSALINRLINRRACTSAPKPGVTRDLKWVRVGGALDLLDAPGKLSRAQAVYFVMRLICREVAMGLSKVMNHAWPSFCLTRSSSGLAVDCCLCHMLECILAVH